MARKACPKCLSREFNWLENKTQIVIECRGCLKAVRTIKK